MRNSPGRTGEVAIQVKGMDGMDKSTCMKKLSFRVFPSALLCFSVPSADPVEPSVHPNKSKHLSINLPHFNESYKLFKCKKYDLYPSHGTKINK